MRKPLSRLILTALIALPLCAPAFTAAAESAPAASGMKIAVLDLQRAIVDTEAAKAAMAALQNQYKPDIDAVNSLRTQMTQLQEKLVKEGEVMSAADRDRIGRDLRDKQADFQFRMNKLQTAQQDKLQEIAGGMRAKLDKVVKDIITAGGYDLVLDRNAVQFVNPAYDITRRVTEKLNAPGG